MVKKQLSFFVILLSVALILPVTNVWAGSVTVATFADPSGEAINPLFTVDWTNSTINGGWADSQSNLDLQIPLTSSSIPDAWFEMDQLAITSTMVWNGIKYGVTGAGQIRFYASGSTTDPVLQIDFLTGNIGRQFLAADEFYADNVTITGSAIPYALSFEQFSFSFANVTNLPDRDGFTSTASFTSSAIPEPATIAMLGLGSLLLLRRKQ